MPGGARRRPPAGHARPQGLPRGDGAAGGPAAPHPQLRHRAGAAVRRLALRDLLRCRAHQRPGAHRARPRPHGGAGVGGGDPRRAGPARALARRGGRGAPDTPGRRRRARRAAAAHRRARHGRADRRRGAQPLPPRVGQGAGRLLRRGAQRRPGPPPRAARPRARGRAPRRRVGLRRHERLARHLPAARDDRSCSTGCRSSGCCSSCPSTTRSRTTPSSRPSSRRCGPGGCAWPWTTSAPASPRSATSSRPHPTSSSSTAASSTASRPTRCCARSSGRWSSSPTAARPRWWPRASRRPTDAAALLELEVDLGQGWYFGRPGPGGDHRRRRLAGRPSPSSSCCRPRPSWSRSSAPRPSAHRAGRRGRGHGDADGLRRRPAPILGCDLSTGPRAAHGHDRAHRRPGTAAGPAARGRRRSRGSPAARAWSAGARPPASRSVLEPGPTAPGRFELAEQWWRALTASCDVSDDVGPARHRPGRLRLVRLRRRARHVGARRA